MSTDPAVSARSSRSGRRTAVLALTGVVALLALLWVGGYAAAGERTPSGTTVAGVDIGGLAPAAAQGRLTDELADRASAPIPVTVAGTKAQVDPGEAGLSLDAGATVARTVVRSWNPVRIARALTGGSAVEPVVDTDDARLYAAVAALAEQTDTAAVDGDVSFSDGAAVVVQPVAGTVLDREQAASTLRKAYLSTTGPVALPSRPVAAKVSAEEVARATREFAEPALSAPVLLRHAGETVSVPARTLARSLDMTADAGGRLQPVLDGGALAAAVEPRLEGLAKAQDATLEIRGGKPVVVPAVAGRRIDAARLSAAVLAVLPAADGARDVDVPTVEAEPELTTAEAKALGVTERLSTFTQAFPYAAYREQNIGRAARYIDGTLLLPGTTFSMNDTVKERTVGNGYTVGTVITSGRFREELGGGVSTITTAMWTAAFYAGMERVEQRAHSFHISRYRAGLEATVSWGSLDLKFRNDTPDGVYIQATAGSTYVTVTMWGTKRYEVTARSGPHSNIRPSSVVYDPKPGCLPQSGVAGFDIVVTRVFRQGGTVVRREPLRTKYNASPQVYCRPAPQPQAPKPAPTPTPDPTVPATPPPPAAAG